MKTEINIIELFSGIGGFTKGFEVAGFKINKHYFSEIDKHAIANYKYNFPNAEFIGDVKSIQSRDITGIDIITFGSPCQDFSMAGKRKGLEGDRSSLIEYAIRIISDLRPSVFIWENVKGAFSSNSGEDFTAIVQAFANIGGYRLEWQLLNTKWFLPQNRERIYLVGHLAGRSWPGIFPISEDNCRITKGSIETRSIRTLTAGGNSGGLHSSMTLINVVERLNSSQDGQVFSTDGISQCLSSGHGNVPKIKINSATKSGYEIANEGDTINISNPNSETRRGRVGKGVAQTLDCACNQAVIGNEQHSIRRLTEIECERLQGFPDDWTKYGNYDGKIKEIPKTQRYKMCGNAVTVAVVKAVVSKIQLI